MKRRDILISIAIVVATLLAGYFALRQTGYVIIEPAGATLQLQGVLFGGAVEASGDPVELTVRAYRPGRLTISGELEGDRWTLTSTGPWGDLERIKVAPGNTTSLKVGPPFRVEPLVGVSGNGGRVQLRILGCAGEQYSNVITRAGRRGTAPKVTIVDREGNVLSTGHFAYG